MWGQVTVVRVQVTPKAARGSGEDAGESGDPSSPVLRLDETRLTHLSWTTPRFCVIWRMA
jgi:hypothetical protein